MRPEYVTAAWLTVLAVAILAFGAWCVAKAILSRDTQTKMLFSTLAIIAAPALLLWIALLLDRSV